MGWDKQTELSYLELHDSDIVEALQLPFRLLTTKFEAPRGRATLELDGTGLV